MNSELVSVLLAASLVAGCNAQRHSLEVWNTGTDKLQDVEVRYSKEKSAQFGVIPSGKSKVRHDIRTPVPQVAEIQWANPDGQVSVVRVDVTGVLPSNYNDGQLTFRIHPDQSVTAHYQKMDLEIP